MSGLTIRPINTGFMKIPKSSVYHESLYSVYDPPERLEGTPVFTFLIEGGDQLALVDSRIEESPVFR